MTLKSRAGPTCQACKYQRRRCPSDCPLAPYFPAERQQQFLSCHRLFGVSNIVKILRRINPALWDDAMKTIIYEAEVRDRDQVHGCVGVINALQTQIESTILEIQSANSQILQYVEQQQQSLQFSSLFSSDLSPNFLDHPPFNSGNCVLNNSSYAENVDLQSVEHLMAESWCESEIVGTSPIIRGGGGGIKRREYDEISPYFQTITENQVFSESSRKGKEPLQSAGSGGSAGGERLLQAAEAAPAEDFDSKDEVKCMASCLTQSTNL